jgi:hypothetical protein
MATEMLSYSELGDRLNYSPESTAVTGSRPLDPEKSNPWGSSAPEPKRGGTAQPFHCGAKTARSPPSAISR